MLRQASLAYACPSSQTLAASMTSTLISLLFLVGPLLGAACYVLGPLCSAAAALVSVRPWWASPVVGILIVPVATLLFTPVCAFCAKPLPMPLPWLLAAVVDGSAATTAALLSNGKTLAAIYAVALSVVLGFKRIRHTLRSRASQVPPKVQ
jgi:hypothetical protein